MLLSGAGALEAKGKKPPEGQDPLLEDSLQTSDESVSPEAQIERRDMPIDMPAKAEKIERAEPAADRTSSPAETPAAAPQNASDQPPQSVPQYQSGRVIETVWVWQETRDCLWRLARKHYGDPWKWKKIYLANRGSILDPNVIYPKQRIEIPSAAE